MKKLGVGLLALPMLAGCFGGFDSRQPAPDTFVLVAAGKPAEAPTVPALAGTLTVRLPRVRGGWDNHELPVHLPDGRSDRLAGALWTSPVDDGVGAVMADTLRTRGAFAAVLRDTSPFMGKWTLELEVAEFGARYTRLGEAPRVAVVLTGVLGRAKDGAVLGTVEGKATVPATADTRTAIAAAFIAAVQAATTQVAAQAEQLAAADR
jgi:ABC-type uncharacterized transport system auxiliary subunit